MSLYDHYSDSKYLAEGWHDVRVDKAKEVVGTKNGTPGVEFTVANDSGSERGVTFWLTEKAVWRLAGFAKACGMSDDEMKAYDENSMASHQSLINHRVRVLVEKGEKYHDVVDWSPIDSETPVVVPKQTPPASELPEPSEDHRDIPF